MHQYLVTKVKSPNTNLFKQSEKKNHTTPHTQKKTIQKLKENQLLVFLIARIS